MDTDYRQRWIQYWMRRAGRGYKGRIATWMASIFAPPYKDARFLSIMNPAGYISPHSTIGKKGIEFGKHVFIDDRVTIFRAPNGGSITLGDRVAVLRDSIIETELDGKIRIGSGTWIHQKCNLSAAMSDIAIGEDVMVAANCSFYPHNHSIEPDIPVARQPLYSLGPIVIGDNAWIGTGVIILSGVTIGEGAVIGAGAVVTKSIPANAVALGVPARVVKMR
jgi:acetyltransferase-like isoleucine patch superfamily enzyme